MKTTIYLVGILFLTACSTRTISIGPAKYKSHRFGTKESFGEIKLTFGTNTFTIKAAESDQVTFAKEVVGAAVREGIQAIK
jgi:hypothetical protein